MAAQDRMSEHFRTLGISRDASDDEIQQAYYRLVRTHHPDHNYGDPEAADRFKRIQLAYEKLSQRISVSSPKNESPFPFMVPDAPRVQFSKGLFASSSFVLILVCSIYGWTQWKLLDVAQSNGIGIKIGQFNLENHSPAESALTSGQFVKIETKQRDSDEGHELLTQTTDSMVYDEPLESLTDIPWEVAKNS